MFSMKAIESLFIDSEDLLYFLLMHFFSSLLLSPIRHLSLICVIGFALLQLTKSLFQSGRYYII